MTSRTWTWPGARAGDRHFTLRRLLRPLTAALIIGLVLDGLDAVAGLALPALVRNGIDHGVETKAFHAIVLVSLIGLAIVLADWVINRAETMVVGRNGERLLYTLRVKLFAQLQRLGLDFYEREMSGRIMTRMTTDVDALSTFLQTGLVTMVSSVLTFFGVLAALLIINLRLGLAVLCIFPVLVVATLVFRSKSARAYAESRDRVATVNADFAENVAGLRVTQAFRREQANRDRFGGLSQAFLVSRLRAQRYIAIYFPFVQTLSTAAGAVVLVLATSQMHSGALTAGALIAYLLYIDMVFAPVQQLSQVFDGYQQAMVGLRRITDLLRLGTSTPPPRRPVDAGRLGGRIELRDVDFGYAQQRRQRDRSGISLTIEPGETVALVGQTGAGKSTLVKLIARFYDATGGQVLVDGTDVRDYDLASYRHQLGVVPQESYLFAGTVRDSIAYARPDASDAEVEAAARATGAHDMITRLTGGYAHEVAERGRNLSAGQRQLIALARAQLADPAILLLDEATAALDLAAEAAVNHAISELTAARTTIVVAHRLTTAARADRIVVLDQGAHRGGGQPRRAARRRRHLRCPVGRLHRRVRARRVGRGRQPGPFGIMLTGVRDVPAALPDGATAGARGGGAPGGLRADPGLRVGSRGCRGRRGCCGGGWGRGTRCCGCGRWGSSSPGRSGWRPGSTRTRAGRAGWPRSGSGSWRSAR